MFSIAVRNVLLTLLYILIGFLLCKSKKAKADHLSTLSAVLVYACGPFMIVTSFLSIEFSWERLLDMGLFFLISLLLQTLFMVFLFLLFRKRYEDARFRIFTIGSVLGNVGFFGLPIVKALLPMHPEVMCYSSMNILSMNVLAFTVGVFCLTRERKYMSWKPVLLNPSSLTLFIMLPIFIFGLGQYVPDVLRDSMALLGNMSTPLCMMILGIRLATVSFKKLFLRPMVYVTAIAKLVLFPLFCYAVVWFLPLSEAFRASTVILAATPCASIILNLAEMHRSETELSANSVLLSTLLSVITIPLIVLIL